MIRHSMAGEEKTLINHLHFPLIKHSSRIHSFCHHFLSLFQSLLYMNQRNHLQVTWKYRTSLGMVPRAISSLVVST